MKKIKAIVKDKTTIELVEPGEVGDVIDLSDLVEVDTSYLEAIIEEGKDKAYLAKLEQAKKLINAENDAKLEKLKSFTMCKILKSLLYNLLIAKNEAIFPNNNPVIEITNNKTDDFFIKFPPINIIISKNNIVVLLFYLYF